MLGAGKGGKPLLEEIDLRAEDELAVGEHRVHPRAKLHVQTGALALQIEERDPGAGGKHKRHRGA